MMNRRNFIRSTALGIGGVSLYAAGDLSGLAQALAASIDIDPFSRPFFIPPVEEGKRNGNQVHFDLNIAPGVSNFVGDLSTPTLGINGAYLGPVLRAKRGDQISFSVKNNLAEKTTLHWHGFVLPARMDGGPHQLISPGETWNPEFDLIQPGATYWYHAHTHKLTGKQVYHGMAGLFIVDDDVNLNSGLPVDYGIDDIPVIIQDRKFNRDGTFQYLGSMMDRIQGMKGDTILVNGVVTPTFKAKRPLTRLRLLNGSNARIYDLAFHDRRPFIVIASDGGFLTQPDKIRTLRLAPGERAEILLDTSNGLDAILINLSQKQSASRDSNATMGNKMRVTGEANKAFNIMKLEAPKSAERIKFIRPPVYKFTDDWAHAVPANKRRFQLEMAVDPGMMMSRMPGGRPFSINGESMDMDVINLRVKSNTFEIWDIGNNSMRPLPFHIHNTQFKIVARSHRAITSAESGLKDTVLVYPREKVRLLVPFLEYSDPDQPYRYHCHILEHEDGGMMGQFTVEA